MVQNSKFTIQLLEKIGAPLAAAIESVALEGGDQDEQAAKIMAKMLGQAVQISISLNSSFNIVEDEAQADSTRLALASLAAPLLADFYRQNESVPEDQDIKRLTKSLESVVAFADNFGAAEEEKSRLTTLDVDAPLFDKTQSALVVMQAMTPAIMAVGDFSFGQSEAKLIQEITNKCEAKAAEIAKKVNLGDKLSELMILKALAALYAECHTSETQKLASQSDASDRGELSLDPVWDRFATRVAMIEAVMGIESPGVSSVTAGNQTPEPAKAETPAQATVTPPPVEAVATPAPAAAPPSDANNPPAGPMGFFKKPDAASPATPPAEPAAPVAAPQEPPPPPPAQPVEAPAEVPAEVSETNAAQSSAAADVPSSPMGFFKPGAKKADDDKAS